MIVFEKKVSTSSTASRMMAAVLTHSRFLTPFSISRFPLSFHRARMCDTLHQICLAVQKQQQTGIM